MGMALQRKQMWEIMETTRLLMKLHLHHSCEEHFLGKKFTQRRKLHAVLLVMDSE